MLSINAYSAVGNASFTARNKAWEELVPIKEYYANKEPYAAALRPALSTRLTHLSR